MNPLDRQAAALKLLATPVARKLLDRAVEGLGRVFGAAGFGVGQKLSQDVKMESCKLVVCRGVEVSDPVSGQVLAARVRLWLDCQTSETGRSSLEVQVTGVEDVTLDPAFAPVALPALVASHPLLSTPAMASRVTSGALLEHCLRPWRGVLKGPQAWDFEARVRPLLGAYEQAVSP